MRIAMFGQKSIPGGSGGVEVVVEELSVRMVQKGHSVVCLNRSERNVQMPDIKEYKGVHLQSLFTVDKKGLAAVTSSISGAIRSAFGRYDVVHIHAEGPAFMCWLPKLFGKRTVVTIHGLDHQRAKWKGFARHYILCGERNAARYADEIIVLSRRVQQYFREKYGRETRYIPNGADRQEKRPPQLIAEKWGLKKDSYILFLGRLVPEKAVRELIQAFKGLKTDKKLVIAGGSSDTEAHVREITELAADDPRILFTGFVRGQLKEELFSNAYFYTLPSFLEGMPLSLLEALSYGCCSLVSDISELTEVVKGKAPVFAIDRGNALKDSLELLLENPQEVLRYREMALELINEDFSWDRIVEKTLELYAK